MVIICSSELKKIKQQHTNKKYELYIQEAFAVKIRIK